MLEVKPIRSDADYRAALLRVDELFDSREGSPEFAELDVLSALIELYEDKRYPIELPRSSVSAIEFRMDQMGWRRRDLVPLLGSSARVSEVMAGKREITMAMARALHRGLGIPAEILLQDQNAASAETFQELDSAKFPLQAMAKLGWIPDLADLKDRAEELIGSLKERAGVKSFPLASLYRKNDHRRINARTDKFALQAWCWQVMAMAASNKQANGRTYAQGTVTPEFLQSIAQLSQFGDGPVRARDILRENGIGLEIVPHLPRTFLDGAALLLMDGGPVIGLTLRFDRIDNFWFCLLHELAHVSLHLEGNGDEVFVDDHGLRGGLGSSEDSREVEADDWAEEALIPAASWEASQVPQAPTGTNVMGLAHELGIHPAVVAGRVRYEQDNYRLLTHFVGSGQIRRQFDVHS